jgi:hypothetical protein
MMAWIYLILILFVFYFGSFIPDNDLEFTIAEFRLHIPLTGSLRLLAYGFIAWQLLWALTRWIEQKTRIDIFYLLDQKISFLQLRRRWLYASRPVFSTWLAVRLAQIGLMLSLIKMFGVPFLEYLRGVAVLELIKNVIPMLVEVILSRFGSAEWIAILMSWLSGPLTEWLSGPVMDSLQDAEKILLEFKLHYMIFFSSFMIVYVNKLYQKERTERYNLDIKRMQERRRKQKFFDFQ